MSNLVYLSEFMEAITKCWQFNFENYPMTDFNFDDAIKHIILHQCKDVGKLAASIEPLDRGKEIDSVLLNRAIRNSLINILRLCSIIGLSPQNLIEDYLEEHNYDLKS